MGVGGHVFPVLVHVVELEAGADAEVFLTPGAVDFFPGDAVLGEGPLGELARVVSQVPIDGMVVADPAADGGVEVGLEGDGMAAEADVVAEEGAGRGIGRGVLGEGGGSWEKEDEEE
jgi:hypothetical protein